MSEVDEIRHLAAALMEAADRLDTHGDRLTPGLRLTAAERIRQIDVEGHTPERDRAHVGSELAWGAYCYLERAAQDRLPQGDPAVPPLWPWKRGTWKPKGSRIRNLVVAAAMIVAEVDRRISRGETP